MPKRKLSPLAASCWFCWVVIASANAKYLGPQTSQHTVTMPVSSLHEEGSSAPRSPGRRGVRGGGGSVLCTLLCKHSHWELMPDEKQTVTSLTATPQASQGAPRPPCTRVSKALGPLVQYYKYTPSPNPFTEREGGSPARRPRANTLRPDPRFRPRPLMSQIIWKLSLPASSPLRPRITQNLCQPQLNLLT